MDPNHPARKRYPPELRERAVRMVLEAIDEQKGQRTGVVTRAARQLGIGPESLRSWVRQAEIRPCREAEACPQVAARAGREGDRHPSIVAPLRPGWSAARPSLCTLHVDAEATDSFDAVIMDCQMPRMDRFNATPEIRRRQVESDSARTPIIGLSARAMEGDSDVAIAKGRDGYLTKPLRVSELRTALEQWVLKK